MSGRRSHVFGFQILVSWLLTLISHQVRLIYIRGRGQNCGAAQGPDFGSWGGELCGLPPAPQSLSPQLWKVSVVGIVSPLKSSRQGEDDGELKFFHLAARAKMSLIQAQNILLYFKSLVARARKELICLWLPDLCILMADLDFRLYRWFTLFTK